MVLLRRRPDPIKVERLCGKLLLITDNDEAKVESKKSARFAKLSEVLKERYILLPVREVENLLPPFAISAVLALRHNENVGQDEFGEVDPIPEFKQEDYRMEPLGRFIEDVVLRGAAKKKAGYAEKSGTIKDKVTFCSEVLAQITRFDQLCEDAQNVTKSVWNFIKERNK